MQAVRRFGFRLYYRLTDLAYACRVATPKRTAAGTYWSYEPTNSHGDDPGLLALARVPTDATLLDIGAHVGEHAIPLALETDRQVVAIEPSATSAERLRRNAARNGLADQIDVRAVGVGDESATRPFYRSTFSKCSAFDRDQATRWGARVERVVDVPVYRVDDLVVGVHGGVDGGGETGGGDTGGGDTAGDADIDTHTNTDTGGDTNTADTNTDADTNTSTHTSTIPPPDAIKIDVEGHELAVCRGANATIDTHRPLLVIEVHDLHDRPASDQTAHATRLRAWLEARGYAITDRDDVWVCRPD